MTDRKINFYFPLFALFTLSLLLRASGIGFGLPGPAFSDEPHHINIAVSFGSGSLDPHIFKYPTFWMYQLFAAFGAVFLGWSGFGLIHSTADFAHMFVWDPSLVYLAARGLTVFYGALGSLFIYGAAALLFESKGAGFLAGLFYALSPTLVYYSHQAKPDTAMLTFSAAAWYFLVRYYKEGQFRDAALAAAALGLACSTQYTALLATPALFLAHALRTFQKRSNEPLISKNIFLAHLFIPLLFFVGSPYILIKFQTFLSDIGDVRAYAQGQLTADASLVGMRALFHFSTALGSQFFGLLLLLASTVILARKNRRILALLGMALIIGIIPLALQNNQAGGINYAFCLFPPAFLMTGALWLPFKDLSKNKPLIFCLMGLLLLPSFYQSVQIARDFRTEDTRVSAKNWIESNIPIGSKILLDQPHTGPFLNYTKPQVDRMREKTKESNPQRSTYFQLLSESHPGGGYEIFRLYRNNVELISLPKHTEWSQKGYEWIDVEEGLAPLKKMGIDTVVWSSLGSTRKNNPRMNKFFDELEAETTLAAEFIPEDPYSPLIKIYSLKKPTAPAKK